MSKVWRRLDERHLLVRRDRKRVLAVTLLREDGSGKAYTHPATRKRPYLKVPYAFWTDRRAFHRSFDLPTLGVLLILLSLPDASILPGEQVSAWYGISSATRDRGIRGLRQAEMLTVNRDQKVAPLAPEGHTYEYRYTLRPPFGPHGIRAKGAPEPGIE